MRTPKHVLQVYQHTVVYGPSRHNAADRRELTRWSPVVPSDAGYLEGETVYLPAGLMREPRFDTCGLLVLHDFASETARGPGHTLPAGPLLDLPRADRGATVPFHIFGLRAGADGIELHLRYSDNRFWIGQPSRADYKLADLRPGAPVLVRINGKSDFTMSAGRERRYLAADFIFEYLGEHSRFEPMERIATSKHPPVEQARLVDLTRILY